jgi:hypothetical protein
VSQRLNSRLERLRLIVNLRWRGEKRFLDNPYACLPNRSSSRSAAAMARWRSSIAVMIAGSALIPSFEG